MHTLGHAASLAADDGYGSSLMGSLQEISELAKISHTVGGSFTVVHDEQNFSVPSRRILHFVIELVGIHGNDFGFRATGRS